MIVEGEKKIILVDLKPFICLEMINISFSMYLKNIKKRDIKFNNKTMSLLI